MRFDLPSIIKGVQYSKKLKIIEQLGEQEFQKIPILARSSLLSTLMIFDDIGSNTDIQRYTSELARSITHLVSDSRHSKNTIFFCAQRPQYLFKSARVLCHVIAVGANIADQYGKHQFEGLYFSPSEDLFYMSNGIQYKELHVNEKMNGALFVYAPDIRGKGHQIHYIRAKKIMEQE
ncbi:MAG: hypothetical protein EZS28_015080 [Streblomastix strix]|uniref:Uncharacterized protein n=1 Tax=Streblomastix strix TaxID=222440 RepID=A0A5J4W3N5_9EUKA|nr:MAG: hypothetical protein EZS28_015080 [Streblomastix strix]